ncbi:MAG TPA: hypothetical protein VKA46_01040, partial [Gemmataceae bacterium]|nr:hypothetical protein [Gemmataceae bacterium]
MSWPLSQDYNEAVQTPAGNFADPDLKSGQVVTNALGLPMPYSGNFADVYQVGCPNGVRWAVKCFTREVPSLRERYEAISRHLRQAKLPFTVDFTYLEKGILVGGGWYPVLKMEWVEGLTLNQFVGQAADKPATLEALLLMWGRLEKYLRGAEVAHADLQHGNVLLVPGSGNNSLALKLVDYDGMWVPALAGGKSGEVGHASYQHPRRLREETYSREVDRFPLLLAATALSGLKARGRALWDKYDNGDNLLFTEADLQAPTKSHLFRDLLHSTDKPTAALATRMIDALQGGLESVPLLEEVMPEAPRPASVRPPSPKAVSPSKAVKVTSVAVGTAPGAAPSPAAGEADAVEVTFVAVGTAPPSGDEALRFDEPPANEAAPAAHSKTTRKKRGGVPVLGWVGGTATLVILAGVAIAMWAFGGWGNGDATNKTPLPPTGVEIDPNPQIVVSFHDTRKNLNYPGLLPGTMRFGLVLRTEAEGGNPKRLTFDQYGCTNNTCLRVDGKDALFGDTRDARWVDRG